MPNNFAFTRKMIILTFRFPGLQELAKLQNNIKSHFSLKLSRSSQLAANYIIINTLIPLPN